MNILAIRTDKPEAEIYIIVDKKIVAQKTWLAHRQLAETLHNTIKDLCTETIGDQKNLEGIVFYNDGESFTGLRIGASVANAFAAGLTVPIVGETGENWVLDGASSLESGTGKQGVYIDPHYSSPVHITQPKK